MDKSHVLCKFRFNASRSAKFYVRVGDIKSGKLTPGNMASGLFKVKDKEGHTVLLNLALVDYIQLLEDLE